MKKSKFLAWAMLALMLSPASAMGQALPRSNIGASGATVTIAGPDPLPISAASLPLPTGAATEATLSALNSKIPSLGAALTASSLPVNIASDQTVPISAASLPLPTGAATEATLADVADVLSSDILDSLTGHEGDFQATASNVGTASAGLPSGLKILVEKDDVLSVLPDADGDFLRLRVDTMGRLHVTSASSAAQVFGAGTEALAQRVTIATDSTGVLSVDDNGGSLTVDGTFFQATQPISAVSLPLPTGAATSALQTTGNAILTTIDADTGLLALATFLEDSVHVSGNRGMFVLAVNNEGRSALSVDGDYSPIATDSTGFVLSTPTRSGPLGAANQPIHIEDLPNATNHQGMGVLYVRDDVLEADGGTSADGDYLFPKTGNFGSAWAALTASDGARIPATVAGGLLVNLGVNNNVSLDSGSNNIGDVDVLSVPSSGSSFFSIKDTAIAAVSQNFAFGFTSEKIIIEAPSSNTDDVCIDHAGGTAVCPAADTAGDDRLAPGVAYVLDNHAVTSVSAISASGTQTITVRAFN